MRVGVEALARVRAYPAHGVDQALHPRQRAARGLSRGHEVVAGAGIGFQVVELDPPALEAFLREVRIGDLRAGLAQQPTLAADGHLAAGCSL